MNKLLSIILILFFIHAGIFSTITVVSNPLKTKQDGRLSGWITNSLDEPISQAMITITCEENSFICYSNDTGHYIQENIPIVFCMWNITVTKQGYYNSYCDMPIGEDSYCNITLVSEEIVLLEVEILAGFSFPSPSIIIRNEGNVPVHMVSISEFTIEGNVIYNNRKTEVTSVLEASDWTITSLNTWLIGFGPFSIMVTVSCDEGDFSSDEINGLLFGPFIFIP